MHLGEFSMYHLTPSLNILAWLLSCLCHHLGSFPTLHPPHCLLSVCSALASAYSPCPSVPWHPGAPALGSSYWVCVSPLGLNHSRPTVGLLTLLKLPSSGFVLLCLPVSSHAWHWPTKGLFSWLWALTNTQPTLDRVVPLWWWPSQPLPLMLSWSKEKLLQFLIFDLRKLISDFVKLDALQTWLQECRSRHQGSCHSEPFSLSVFVVKGFSNLHTLITGKETEARKDWVIN